MTRKSSAAPRARARRAVPAPEQPPRSIPILAEEPEEERMAEQPFEEGAADAVDPDLRHRMISEVAFGMYAQRGFADGFDVDDWLAAETHVDHLLLARAERETGSAASA
ncbi:MAG: DUF2934 domain-containing protein [Burkholderiales bacterium]|nr:DUF2934 domain-containing protein [Burkholderiales bacterium]